MLFVCIHKTKQKMKQVLSMKDDILLKNFFYSFALFSSSDIFIVVFLLFREGALKHGTKGEREKGK